MKVGYHLVLQGYPMLYQMVKWIIEEILALSRGGRIS